MARSLAGTRIRQKRRALQVTQSALAAQAGISPSYLNLIEHNRRGVAGRVLLGLARALKVAPGDLVDGAEDALLGELRELAVHRPDLNPETDSVEDLVGRFPGWSRTLASLHRQNLDQETVITALSDRLTHNPFLRESLHLMLSAVTAIYSTANILDTVDDVPPDQTRRFHANIHAESNRLSEAVGRLVDYFDQASDETGAAAAPQEEFDQFLASNAYHFPALDAEAAASTALSASDADTRLRKSANAVLDDAGTIGRGPSSALARQWLLQYARDACVMPLAGFAAAARSVQFEPVALARQFQCDLHAVFRRLATLRRPGIGAPSIGLIIVNAAGQALYRRPLPEFSLPRHGSACALWPVFQSIPTPNTASIRGMELPDGRRFAALSIALSEAPAAFNTAPLVCSAMLIVPEDAQHDLPWLRAAVSSEQKIGLSCRICPRERCPARYEPLILPPRPAG